MRRKLFGVAALALALALLLAAGASSQPKPMDAPLPPSAVADEPPRSHAATIRALMKSLAAVREQRARLDRDEQELLARIRKELEAMRAEAGALERQLLELEGLGDRKAEGKGRDKEKGPRAEEKGRDKDKR
jgi:hypothetical protein